MISYSDRFPVFRRSLRRASVLNWLRMMRLTGRIMRRSAEHLAHYGLSNAQFDVLAQVGAHEGITQAELAQRLLVTQGNITQLVDSMERAGLVRRVREGRAKRLYLTDAGRERFAASVPAQEDFIARQFDALTREEQGEFLRLLGKLERGLR
jgi:DNA-binding MarR family transcriptional regulator